jgi:hypothetical protein
MPAVYGGLMAEGTASGSRGRAERQRAARGRRQMTQQPKPGAAGWWTRASLDGSRVA